MHSLAGNNKSPQSPASLHQQANQSILISGESGAGKTESTKYVLKYLTTVGCSTNGMVAKTGSIMDKVLQSNPILEAFGNAKTVRNNNSSRFGKFIALNFNRRGHLVGSTIRTYLLEKVRLVSQQPRERNYHIFYFMLAGCSEAERQAWGLGRPEHYSYTNQGQVFEIKHMNQAEEFHLMKEAFKTLNFSTDHQVSLLNAMAGLLHLGQLKFVNHKFPSGDEGCVVAESALVPLQHCCSLFGIDKDSLVMTLTQRNIVTKTESYVKLLSATQAVDARDAVAKAVYGRLFDWIVRTINVNIAVEESAVRANIGVLDIFGFECFKHNSFEQLCINYTNETLQQQFNQFVFKLEQKEYEREKIQWSFIHFPDNQDCLDLIEDRLKGILAMLDDECKLPGASDEKLANRLYKAYEANSRFSATPTQKRSASFCVKHYAGAVVYSCYSFVDKNKDELPREALLLVQGSAVPLLAEVFSYTPPVAVVAANAIQPSPGKGVRRTAGGPLSVGSQFKEQLQQLMETVYATTPHYIRCLKPNDENIPDSFNRRRTTEQLRYGGVLEAVRVARSGFPVRLSHVDFFARYHFMTNPFTTKTQPTVASMQKSAMQHREVCDNLIRGLWDDTVPSATGGSQQQGSNKQRLLRIAELCEWGGHLDTAKGRHYEENVQIGETKVFLRKQAHDLLENRRAKRMVSAARMIQGFFKTRLTRLQYLTTLYSISLVQRLARGYLARSRVAQMRRLNAALRVQTCFRRYRAFRNYHTFTAAVTALQSCWRGKTTRRVLAHDLFIRNVVRVQRLLRGLPRHRAFRRLRRAVLSLQCRVRMRQAKGRLRELRARAKDMGLLQQSNAALKTEIEELRARAAAETARAVALTQTSLLLETERMSRSIAELKDALDSEKKHRVQFEEKWVSSNASLVVLQERFTDKDRQLLSVEQRLAEAKSALAAAEQEVADVLLLKTTSRPTSPPTLEVLPQIRKKSLTQKLFAPMPEEDKKIPSTGPLEDAAVLNSAKYKALQEQLFRERNGRESLEEEVSRLRGISMDLKAQLDQTKQQPGASKPDAAMRRLSSKSYARRMSLKADLPPAPPPAVEPGPKDSSWIHAWDDAGDAAVLSPLSDTSWNSLSAAPSPSTIAAASSPSNTPSTIAIGTFEKNLETFRSKLRKGIRCFLWEGQRVANLDAVISLDAENTSLLLTQYNTRRLFSISLTGTILIAPIRITDIFECLPGAELPNTKIVDAACLLTLVAKSSTSGNRILAVVMPSRDERNALLTGIRSMVSDLHINTPTMKLMQSIVVQPLVIAVPEPPARSSGKGGGGLPNRLGARRLTLRDSVLEEAAANMDESSSESAGRRRSLSQSQHEDGPASGAPPDDINNLGSIAEVKRQLLLERSNHERMMVQMLMLTNDLNDREEQIRDLKTKEQHMSQTLTQKEAMFEQDAMVRLQLGKRLEQVLMDKEDAEEQLDMMKMQLDSFHKSFAIVANSSARGSIKMSR